MMKCYYEVLCIPRDASDDDLKKSYRKLALKWHPDKNPDNLDEANREFILVQQAYEVLIDPQERAWYDKHRESILKGAGSGYEDDSLDIYPFFTLSCFRGYEDDDKGFYSVYREVFKKLGAEESEYLSEDDDLPPEFGDSQSPYELVNKFYGYWSSFCTKKSYSWLNSYDISEAENRRILRLMEQENKKVRDRAKKERNEEIRELVSFVRKRDKRVLAYADYLKQKTEENSKKAEANRRKMIAKHREDIERYKESEWSKFSNVEERLVEIESSIAAEYNDGSDESDEDDLFCVACNKYFKTEKSFANHEKSKKHIENVALLKSTMAEEETFVNGQDIDSDISDLPNSDEAPDDELNRCEPDDEKSGTDSVPSQNLNLKRKKNSKCKKKKQPTTQKQVLDEDICENNLGVSKKQLKKLEREKILAKTNCESSESESKADDAEKSKEVNNKSKKSKKKKNLSNDVRNEDVAVASKSQKKKQGRQKDLNMESNDEDDDIIAPTKSTKKTDKRHKKKGGAEIKSTDEIKIASILENLDLSHECAVCQLRFDSKNKLFEHLKTQGHQMFLPTKVKNSKTKNKN